MYESLLFSLLNNITNFHTANTDTFKTTLTNLELLGLGLCGLADGNQLAALATAASSSIGWRSDSYKVIALFSSSTFGEGVHASYSHYPVLVIHSFL